MIKRVEIKHDLFDIVKRLKAIEDSYRVYYNYIKKQFEVYSYNNYCLTIGTKLNNLALKKAFYTHIRNKNRIFKDIERDNDKLRKKEEDEIVNKAKYQLSTRIDYADKKGGDISFCDIDKTKWF